MVMNVGKWKLATTNPIESCLSTVQRVARNVKRWREGNQPLRCGRLSGVFTGRFGSIA
jgi:hypothetical protein